MCRKLIYFVSFVLVLGLVGNASAQLPPGWSQRWIGDETPPGTASYNASTSTFTLTGHGHDIWDNADDFHYVYQPLSGNGEITARVITLTGPSSHTWSKAGVMIRETLTDTSTAAWETVTGGDGAGIGFQWRTSTGGGCGWTESSTPVVSPPYWVRVRRTGNLLEGFHSPDGVTWTKEGEITISMVPNVYAGLCLTSHESGVNRTATFDNVSIEVSKLAWNPSPANGTVKTDFPGGILGTSLSWSKGATAATHDVYFGTDYDEVAAGTGDTFQGNQGTTFFLVGYGYTPTDPLPGGLVPGTRYYWRIDEVESNGTTKHPGPVWNFLIPPMTAYNPKPADGALDVSADPVLSWTGGFGAIMYTPYFGESYEEVDNLTGGAPGPDTSFTPPGSPLEVGTTYYWRVDTMGVYGQFKGEIWSFTTIEGGTGRILREVWTGIGGTAVGDLTGNARYPDDPDIREYITVFDGPVDWADNYGTRIHGWLYVPTSGDYTFWVAGDDYCNLYLSTDIDPSNKQLIAQVPGWTGYLAWTTYPEQQSSPISLVGGEKYFIEALQKEAGGGDSISVSWRGPASPIQSLIAGEFLCPTPYDPVRAYAPSPGDGSTTAPPEPTLTWLPGKYAESHQLYFGTSYNTVANATTASPEYVGPRALGNESYTPGKLEWEGTYYWRVDEISNTHPDSPWKGTTWTFTTTNYLIVDNFEDYSATEKEIWAIWHDGLGYWDLQGTFHPGNGTGSAVGDENNDDTYMEETIVHNGSMSMPYFYNNGDPTKMKYSEAKLTLKNPPPRGWTEGGIKALSLWFRGYPESTGGFTDNLNGTYTMTASGTDIWDVADYTGAPDGYYHDEFHFAYKSLTGVGSIIARVDSVQNTNEWAKAGVMIRETLDANSVHAFMCVTPSQGVAFQNRPTTGFASVNNQVTGISAPQWVKIERDLGGNFTASYSSDGQNWTIVGAPEPLSMGPNAYIGLALTSHDASLTCQAEFSNVQVSVSGPWSHQDIGIQSNDPDRIYVSIANSNGTTGTVYYEDNDNIVTDATQIGTWTEFMIDLKDFQDQGVNLADVNSVTIGIGTRGSTTAGGAGKMYFDDILLYRPRYIPGKGTPLEADINADGIVDYRDLKIMTNNWLNAAETLSSANLIARYNFENNLLDSIGSNNGTAMGSPTYSPGIDGQAIDLDGVDDYVETNKTPSDLGIGGGAAKTVVAWAYTRSFNNGGIFDMGDNVNGENFSLRTLATTNTWRAQRWGYPTYDFDFTYPSLDEWVHFALVYDGNDAGNESRAYADGVLVGTQTIELDTADTRTFAIGVWSGNYFDGLIDDLRVYGRALSTGEIISLAGGSALDHNDDMKIDFKDYAVFVDQWLEKQLWPEW